MRTSAPQIVVIAGPNGAGKTTSSASLLRTWNVWNFVNADRIALGLDGLNPDAVAVAAGRIMLQQLRDLANERVSFSSETTLASRTFARWLSDLMKEGYRVHIDFFWLATADLAVKRVIQRRAGGGHFVPEETVRRRYALGLKNFFNQYRNVVTSWSMWNNTSVGQPSLIATRRPEEYEVVHNNLLWRRLCAEHAT
jgi:predicted ABC-type ATPase